MDVLYIGSGPYCYANSLAMVMGAAAPPPSAIEVLTGAPFGFHLGGGPAWFDPSGWDPGAGLDMAIDLLGWSCERSSGGSAGDAVERLRDAHGPVLVGPVELGLLRHHPGSGEVLDSDHFMVVTGVTDGTVHFHDPHGFPFATLPVDEFTTGHLVHFAVRVGARRLADAAAWLARLGLDGPAAVAERQARLVGGLQYPLVQDDRESAVELLRRLGPTYAELDAELGASGVPNGGRPEQFVARNG